jgi:hypothetical protein
MPSIFKRKLIPMGKGGLVVTVPKCWSDYYRLKPGDLVTITIDKGLHIRPEVLDKKAIGQKP